ncbi:5-formyltetrahydrofolate cyclo-ligase [Aliidiomarina sp. Khilg15.8]
MDKAAPPNQSSRQAYRQRLKAARSELSHTQQTRAALDLVQQTMAQPEVKQAQTVAAYFSFGSELNTEPLLQALLDAGKRVCLPVLHPFTKGHLLMLHYDKHSQLVANRYGIPEPALRCPDVIPFSSIDCLLTPLVGFDAAGNRLGMGGGFYDRTLASWQRGRYPGLSVFGLGHDCQFVEKLPVQPWDVPLPAVITPTRCWRFSSEPL